jgi:hypothetical protein
LGQLLDNANLDRSLAFPARAFLFFNDTVLGTKKQTLPPTPVTFLKDRLASAAQTDPDLRAFLRDGLDFSPTNNERLFKVMAAVSNDALRTLTTALDGDRPRKSRDLARVASGITGLGVVLAPYLAAFRAESRDRPLMRSVRERWLSDGQTPVPSVAMFADEASHGLTEDAEALALMEPELAEGSAIELFGLAAAGSKQSEGLFEAVATVPLHWFPTGRVALPPTLEVAHALVNRDVQALYVHSVGPMGLLGALLGGLLRIPVVARCPVECLAHAETSSLFERYLQLFFGLCREVRASSQEAHDAALAFGVPADSTILAERVAVSTAA